MSRTDHPRIPGTHRAIDRAYRYDDWDDWMFSPRVASTQAKHEAIKEGLDEYRAMNPIATYEEDVDPFWLAVWERDRLVIENFRLLEHLKQYQPKPSTGHINHLIAA